MKIKTPTKIIVAVTAILAGGIWSSFSTPVVNAGTPASDSENIDITVNVKEAISLTVDNANVSLGDLTPSSSGVSKATDVGIVATVVTNHAGGWELQIKDADTDATLKHSSLSNNFSAHTGTPAAPTALGTTDVWGYRVGTWTASTYAGVTTSAAKIAEGTSFTAGAATNIAFTAQLAQNSSLPTGTYSDTIVLIAYTK